MTQMEEYRVECLNRLREAHDTLNRIETTFKGSLEFRDAVFELLEGTPFAAPVGDDFEGLYGRLRSALKSAASVPLAAQPETPEVTDIRLMPDFQIVKVLEARAAHDANKDTSRWIFRLLRAWVTDGPLTDIEAILREWIADLPGAPPGGSPAR